MYVIFKLTSEDLTSIANGECLEIRGLRGHTRRAFVELENALSEDELRLLARNIRSFTPAQYKGCAECKGTRFDSTWTEECPTCDGTGRILLRPSIHIGDTVTFGLDTALSPWGEVEYPVHTKTARRMSIPRGTKGVVVDISDEKPSRFTVDLIIERELYRMVVEDHYIQVPLEGEVK